MLHPLFLALLPVVVAPWLAMRLSRHDGTSQGLDAFVVVSVGGLVLFHILPDSAEVGGPLMVVLAGLGLAVPWLWERRTRQNAKGKVSAVLHAVALGGLVLHEMLDGAALARPDPWQSSALAWAVLLHRLPAALALWLLANARFGTRRAWQLIGLALIATCSGFFFAPRVLPATNGLASAGFQALLAGILLHVLVHHDPNQADKARRSKFHVGALAGVALGAGVLFAARHIGSSTTSGPLTAGVTLGALAFESAPAILVGFGVAGAVHAWFPERWTSWLTGASGLSQAVRGAAVGLPLNLCSCGVTPVYRSLILRGVPGPAAVAFLVAAPELGIASVVLSYQLLGGRVTIARVFAAAVLAIGVGTFIGARIRSDAKQLAPRELHISAKPSAAQRWKEAARFGFGEMVDHTGPWILVGLTAASVVEPLIRPEQLSALPDVLEVPLLALVGTPMYVCASASTPLAAVLMHKGISPGAAIAFLLTGPATNLTTIGVLARLHSKRIAIAFPVATTLVATLLGLAVNAWLPGDFRVPLHEMAEHNHGWIEWGSVAALVVLLAASVLRQGVRGLLTQVFALHSSADPHLHAGDPVEHGHHHHDGCCGGAHSHPEQRSKRSALKPNRLAPVRMNLNDVVFERVLSSSPLANNPEKGRNAEE